MVEKPRAFDPRKRFYFDPLSPDFQGPFFRRKGSTIFRPTGSAQLALGGQTRAAFPKAIIYGKNRKEIWSIIIVLSSSSFCRLHKGQMTGNCPISLFFILMLLPSSSSLFIQIGNLAHEVRLKVALRFKIPSCAPTF